MEIKALIDSGSNVNAIALVFLLKLGFKVCFTNIRAQKIYSSIFQTFGMVRASFYIEDKLARARFF